MPPVLHVAIAEDIPRLAHMTKTNLELSSRFKVVFVAENGKAMLRALEQQPNLPDIILMDIKMPEMNGIETTEAVKQKYPQIKVVMATVFDDEQSIFDAILNGADGYLLKDEHPEVLHRSLEEVMDGGAPMSPVIATKALKLLRSAPVQPKREKVDNPLTEREQEILGQLSKGLRYKQVGANLFISEGTVRKHIENIYRKLQVHNKTAAVETARKKGFV